MKLSGRFTPLRANTLSLIAVLAGTLVVGERAADDSLIGERIMGADSVE